MTATLVRDRDVHTDSANVDHLAHEPTSETALDPTRATAGDLMPSPVATLTVITRSPHETV